MKTVTSNYKRTEQNGVSLSNLSLFMASYSLQTTGSQVLYERREFTIMTPQETLKQKYIKHVLHAYYWLHIHTVALSQQLLYRPTFCKCGDHVHKTRWLTLLHVSLTVILVTEQKFLSLLVAQLRNYCTKYKNICLK